MVKPVLAVVLGIIAVVTVGCRHGIEIEGQGNVTSQSGTRNCTPAASPCRFDVEGDYLETYTATPATGWIFDAWERCQSASGNQCAINVDAQTIDEYQGLDVPGVLARFRLPIEPLFRDASGEFFLPEGSATNHLRWLLEELSQSSTSISEINARFHPNFLAEVPATTLQADIQALRNAVSNPVIDDLITATPVFARAVVAPRNSGGPGFFISIDSTYGDGSNDGLITGLWYRLDFGRNGLNVEPAQAGRSLGQLSQSFKNAAQETSLLVARIENDKCSAMASLSANTPRATASIFKLWVVGALAEEIRAGRINASTMVPLNADDIVPVGARINDVSLGTQIPLRHMANLMLGVSDNTATDHLHALIGRNRVEKILKAFKHKNRRLMQPLLNLNEQFHILWSLPPAQANSYASASEAEQRAILKNSLEPLGPVTNYPEYNESALYDSSWRASAFDVCQAYAGLRQFDNRSPAFELMDQAAGADAVLLSVRKRWDRVWQKGGSLANVNGNYVFTLSWLFESDDKGAYVIVMMAGNPDGSPIDSSSFFSIAARAEQILHAR